MIDDGFITRNEYEGYIKQMHERMWSCFDFFLPEIVPNNIIEQYSLKKNDIFFMCCDGLSDWITPENMNIRKRKLSAHGVCFTFFSIAY